MALCGPTSTLWRNLPIGALILAATIPSGSLRVVEARSQIDACSFGPGFRPRSFEIPIVVHCPKLVRALPIRHIYIGAGSAARFPSQWMDPTLSLSQPELDFKAYLGSRADIELFVGPLFGKILVCDCSRGDLCHGHVLCEACVGVAGDMIEEKKDEFTDVAEKAIIVDEYKGMKDVIVDAGFIPSGKASAGGVGSRVSAASQPTKRVLPQLIEDGFTPEEHLKAALSTVHPFQREPCVFEPIEYALQHSIPCHQETNKRRLRMSELIEDLCNAVALENEYILSKTHPNVHQVLKSGGVVKNVAAMREIQFIVQAPDFAAIPSLVTGISMVGHCDAVYGMMERQVDAEYSVEEFVGSYAAQNVDVLKRIKPSGDSVLDHGT
jgi:hypothetical protein